MHFGVGGSVGLSLPHRKQTSASLNGRLLVRKRQAGHEFNLCLLTWSQLKLEYNLPQDTVDVLILDNFITLAQRVSMCVTQSIPSPDT